MSNVSEALLLEHFRRDLSSFEAVHRRGGVVIMEVHEDVEGNAFNAYDASDALDATTAMEEDLSQPAQIEGIEVEGNQLVSLKALKATSGNAEKRLRIRQETRSTINSGKTTGAATRPRATQERLVEKERMKAWKQVIMQEVKQGI